MTIVGAIEVDSGVCIHHCIAGEFDSAAGFRVYIVTVGEEVDVVLEVLTPLCRPEEQAAALLLLCSLAASFVLGATLAADGGFTAK